MGRREEGRGKGKREGGSEGGKEGGSSRKEGGGGLTLRSHGVS